MAQLSATVQFHILMHPPILATNGPTCWKHTLHGQEFQLSHQRMKWISVEDHDFIDCLKVKPGKTYAFNHELPYFRLGRHFPRLQEEVKQRAVKRAYDQIGAFEDHWRYLKDRPWWWFPVRQVVSSQSKCGIHMGMDCPLVNERFAIENGNWHSWFIH